MGKGRGYLFIFKIVLGQEVEVEEVNAAGVVEVGAKTVVVGGGAVDVEPMGDKVEQIQQAHAIGAEEVAGDKLPRKFRVVHIFADIPDVIDAIV